MEISEKELEDMIWEAAISEEGRNFLAVRGLSLHGTLFRQVGLGNYGVADMVGIAPFLREVVNGKPVHTLVIDVYELKKGNIGLDALGQALRYQEGLIYFIQKAFPRIKLEILTNIHLVGYDIDQSRDFIYFARAAPNVYFYQYRFSYTGLEFQQTYPGEYRRVDYGNPTHKLFNELALKSILKKQLYYDHKEGQ